MALVRNSAALKVKSNADVKVKGSKNVIVSSFSEEIRTAIDSYVEVTEDIKNLEAKQKELSREIRAPALDYYLHNVVDCGVTDNYKIAGNHACVSFICQNKGYNIPIETINEVEGRYGEDAVNNLFDTDWKSYHLNPEIMNNDLKRDMILQELEKLNKKFGFSIFTEGSFKIKENFVDRARTIVKTTEELDDLLTKGKLVIFVQKAKA
jgi:hypothetical protein